jgi:hypothetical protein
MRPLDDYDALAFRLIMISFVGTLLIICAKIYAKLNQILSLLGS